MTESPSGYRIGFRELYELVMQVSAKLDTVTAQQATQIQANTSRIDDLSKGMRMMWDQIEKNKAEREVQIDKLNTRIETRGQSTWQINLAIAGSGISLLAALAGFLVK
jgi:TolA-binding protein